MPDSLTVHVKDLLRPSYMRARYLQNLALDAVDVATGRRRPLVPPRRLITIGGGDFLAVGRTMLSHLIRLAQLAPESRVLDVGCGCGRIAVALSSYLSAGGSYQGFDIHQPYIDWATREITPRHPNFRFQVSDIYNKQYNPGGRIQSVDYAFPFPDRSFDVVILISVFTHMLPRDVEHYLSEIRRVLVPGGRCFSTFFVINPTSAALIAQGKSAEPINVPLEGCLVKNRRTPEFAVGYQEVDVRTMLGAAGLAVAEPIHYGSWSGRLDFVDFQDIIVSGRT